MSANVMILDAEGVPAALTDAEKALWKLARGLSSEPMRGDWRVSQHGFTDDGRWSADVNAKTVISTFDTPAGARDGSIVARCPSSLEADYIGGLSPRAVLAMLNELATLRSGSGVKIYDDPTPGYHKWTTPESRAEAVADFKLPPAPYRSPVKLDTVEDKYGLWHDDEGFLNAAGVKEVVRLYTEAGAPMSQIAKHVGLRSSADVRNVLERAGAIDDEIARRNAAIRKQAEQGMPYRQIGEPYELTAGRVQQIVRRA